MWLLLDLLYIAALVLISPWLFYQAVTKGKYREGLAAKLFGRVPKRKSNALCIWFHAVSVGEVRLLLPLISEIERRRPEWDCVVSTTTATGYGLARLQFARMSVYYCPLDFSWAVRRAMRRIRPTLLVLAELELWPNLVRAAQDHGVGVAVINGRLSERSFRGYRRVHWLMRHVLAAVDVIAAQSDEYARRFRELGADQRRVHVTGSIKYDGAQCDRNNPATERLRRLAGISPSDAVFLAGSTQEPEEAIALAVYGRLAAEFPCLRLIVVPRHPHRFDEVAALFASSGVAWQRRSDLSDGSPPHPSCRVLLVDTVGELGAWWGTAQIAFVGGSLGNRGGQNMIEPAAYGAAVCFGPNTRNFRDTVESLLANRAAVVVHDERELGRFVRRCLAEPHFSAELGERAAALVAASRGATGRTLDLLEPLVESAANKCVVRGAAA